MRRRTFVALTLALCCAAAFAVRTLVPETVTVVPWKQGGKLFGGWSAIDVTEDGMSFLAIGDSGVAIRGVFIRNDGQLIGAEPGKTVRVRGETARKNLFKEEDAEGVSFVPGGGHVISYEGYHRIVRHEGWRKPALTIVSPASVANLEENGSLEAVAVDQNGTVVTLAEMPDREKSVYPVFRYDPEGWEQPFALQQDGRWRAVGADFGADGLFYLLERQFLGFGFRSQIRRFDLTKADEVLKGTLLYRSLPGRHGNLEGIGVWRGDDGRMRATMVSDDNYLPFLRSQIVEVILPE